MEISKEIAQELACCSKGEVLGDFTLVLNEIRDSSRWSIQYELIVQKDGKFYRSWYQVGATEMQDERPFEYDSDPIEFPEVFPVEVTVTEYRNERP